MDTDAVSLPRSTAETLVKLSFALQQHQAYFVCGLDMVVSDVVNAYIAAATVSMRTARDCMASAAKIESAGLPIAVGLDFEHLEVSILLPADTVDADKADLLAALGQLAKQSLDRALTHLSKPQGAALAPPSLAGEASGVGHHVAQRPAANSSSSEPTLIRSEKGKPNPFDMVAGGLVAALNKKKRPGEITVSVSSGDREPQGVRFTVVQPGNPDPDHVTFSRHAEEITITVHGRISHGLCEVKEAGASARTHAKYGTSGRLPLQLRLVDGGHPVTVLARRRSGVGQHDRRVPSMYIEEITSLDRAWHGEGGGLATLRQVLDSLQDLCLLTPTNPDFGSIDLAPGIRTP